jgi:hypothetical protein
MLVLYLLSATHKLHKHIGAYKGKMRAFFYAPGKPNTFPLRQPILLTLHLLLKLAPVLLFHGPVSPALAQPVTSLGAVITQTPPLIPSLEEQ